MIRIACCQWDVARSDFPANKVRFMAGAEEAKERGADLVVFPECFLTGYAFSSSNEAKEAAVTREEAASLQAVVERLDLVAIVGFAEKLEEGVANSVILLEPGVAPRFYRKVHLPCIGLDRFANPGNELPIFETRVGRIGILICFDQRPPEAARVLALGGADLICLPTNWPEGAEMSAHVISQARAAENRVCYAACNRAGSEGGFRFIGASGIYDVTGRQAAKAGSLEEIIWADLDLTASRQKRAVVVPCEYEWTVDESRRPDLYGSLTQPHERSC